MNKNFFISFFITLISLIVFAYLYVNLSGGFTRPKQEEVMTNHFSYTYTPSNDEFKTLLVATKQQHQGNPIAYTLFCFDPINGRIPVATLPIEMLLNTENGASTIDKTYQNSGILAVVKGISENFEITIDHYVEIDLATMRKLIDKSGSFQIDFPLAINYEDEKNLVTIPKGLQQFGGEKVIDTIRPPIYKEGVEARCNTISFVLSSAINEHITLFKKNQYDPIFDFIINEINTNISKINYESLKPAIAFVANLSTIPSKPLKLIGGYDGTTQTFTPSSPYYAMIKQLFRPQTPK